MYYSWQMKVKASCTAGAQKNAFDMMILFNDLLKSFKHYCSRKKHDFKGKQQIKE